MKKVISLLLALVLCLSLCACGKSEAVKNVEAMIDALGEITLESIDAIRSAEDAYNALTEDEQKKVGNYETLTEARDAYYELALVGEWVRNYFSIYDIESNYEAVSIILNSDMTGTHYEDANKPLTWSVVNSQLHLDMGHWQNTYNIIEENGILYFHYYEKEMPEENITWQSDSAYLSVSDFHSYLNSIVKVIDLSQVDINEYCELYFHEEHELDDFDEPTGNIHTRVMIRNKLFDDGWYYFSGTDIAIEVNYPQYTITTTNEDGTTTTSITEAHTNTMPDYDVPFTHDVGTVEGVYVNSENDWSTDLTIDQLSFGRSKGVLYFIHSDYVKEVKRGDDGYRMLVLINGFELYTDPWNKNIDY